MQPDFSRYSCQLLLPNFGEEGQHLLQNAKVLIAGIGGLGCPAAQYLAAAGIGTIGLADFDIIAKKNLHRQILFSPADIGFKKTNIACKKLREQNPDIFFIEHDSKINAKNVSSLIAPYDIIVDCTDNFDTRYALNDACVLAGKPLAYGAIYQYEGQIAVWNMKNEDETYSPNYRDLFPEVNAAQIPNCTEGGVIPTIAGIIGVMQANEVIKYFIDPKNLLAGKLLIMDALTLQSRIIKMNRTTAVNIAAIHNGVAVPLITVQQLKAAISKNIYSLIDVRTTAEREIFDIGGANIPLQEIANAVNTLQIDKPIICYCSSGQRSAEAVKIIREKFPSAVIYSLEGGLDEWEN